MDEFADGQKDQELYQKAHIKHLKVNSLKNI